MENKQKVIIALIVGVLGYFFYFKKNDNQEVEADDLFTFLGGDDETDYDLDELMGEAVVKHKLNKGISYEMKEGKAYEAAKSKAIQEINMNPSRYE